ncbi:PEP-utilizing enzyme [uncultured Draconibacterium sp.]|uniref:PEP-utilizing enzyme n=1 Tax=uncultured Draconibacterium sp. TaxID=1573823 RepID=UPI002AA8E1BB|nr:PEP-utilizing enzyme [uncultured Draconibacterium sp.]
MNKINDIKTILEQHFRDAVDFEFTIQNGKLWVLNALPLKRLPFANIKIITDLFFEKLISLNDAIERIRLSDISEVLTPFLINEERLTFIGKGLPASPGAATGKLYFFPDDILKTRGSNCIFCRVEVSPEDVEAMRLSNGIITSRGGMTSHAAVKSRKMGKPCVSGIGALEIDYKNKFASINGLILKEGDWLTINSSTGQIYKGRGNFQAPHWSQNKYVYLFSRLTEKAICTNKIKDENIGKAWLLRDFFLHNTPFEQGQSEKKKVNTQKYISFSPPSPDKIQLYYSKINDLSSKYEDIAYIIRGLRNSLIRQLANKIGIGNHYKYYRPLLDPMSYVQTKSNPHYENLKVQLIGEEFFNVGKYLPNLIDIYKIRILMIVQCTNDSDLSFLDFTNPRGESIILKENKIIGLSIEINDQEIGLNRLPQLYNTLRKREYFWTWYSDNHTSHKEIIDFLNTPQKARKKNFRLNTYAHELELLVNNSLTKSGKSLIN